MAKALPLKALIAITSYHGVIYPDGTKTGLFFTEALHPFEVLTQAGFEVDFATETGTFGLDDLSLTSQFLAGDDKSVFENPKHSFNVKLNSQLKKASDLNKEDYGLFFASAGHAALSMTTQLPEDFRRLQETSGIGAASSPPYAMDR